MSKYTTELRFICETASGLDESAGYNSVAEIISKSAPKIFSFHYPIFDESYRRVLETKILKHFYTREICEETYGLWKLRLDTKLNEIMPYYNKLYETELLKFNPLYTVDMTSAKKNNTNTNGANKSSVNGNSNTANNGRTNTTSNGSSSELGNGTNGGSSLDKFSDTPQGAITNLEEGKYLTNAREVTNNAISHSEASSSSHNTGEVVSNDNSQNTYNSVSDNVSSYNTVEDYIEHVQGYQGKLASESIKAFRDIILNIDVMILRELESLFFGLW